MRVTATRAELGFAARQELDLLQRNQQSTAQLQRMEADCQVACAQLATCNQQIANVTHLIAVEKETLEDKERDLGVQHGRLPQPLQEHLPLPSQLQLHDYIAELQQAAASER